MALLFVLLVSASPAFSQWRTGYFMQGEAAGQTVSTIPWSKYTHVIHYAIKPNYNNGSCGFDTSYGISGSNITNFVSAARAAGVKSVIGIMQDDSVSAIRTCTDSSHVGQFVSAISNFVNSNGYDGVDIDWESGIVASQYQDLITRLRAAMPSAVITTAVTVTERHITAAVQDKLDQINLMAYDLDFSELSGSTINYTWYNAATFQGSNTQNNAMNILAWYYVSDAGNDSRKIGIGVPFYGRIKRGCTDSSGSAGVTDPNQGWVSGGSRGAILYRDLVNSVYWNSGTRVWDEGRKSQYIRYKGGSCSTDAFLPFTGPEQLQAVVAMIKANNYGGIMTYGLPYEYMPNQSGDAQYPLSSAIHNAMGGGSVTTAPSITTVSPLAAATVGTAYSTQLSATGSAPITWAVTSGALPAGLALSTTSGLITGTPTASGPSTFTAQASNGAGSVSRSFSLTVNAAAPAEPAAPSITTVSPLPPGTAGTAYSAALAATGSTPLTWALASGTLPAGLALNSDTGAIEGTPAAAGTSTFAVTVSNSAGSNSKTLSLTINPQQETPTGTAPVITASSPLPAATVGTAYSLMLGTSSTSATWSLPAGSLPTGLWLAAGSGAITGTPSATGTWNFTVEVANSSGSTRKSLSLTVGAASAAEPEPAPVVATSSLPAGTAGVAYAFTLAATSSTPVTWSLAGGSLPAGLTLAATGAITGTPSEAGARTFTVQASNSAGSTSGTLSLSIASPEAPPAPTLAITTSSPLAAGTVGVGYALALATSSANPVTWSLPAGSLPPGLWLAAGSGAIAGTPTTAGTWNFAVQASDGTGSASKSFSLTIGSLASLSITTASLPRGYVSNGYSIVLTTTSATPVEWSLPVGSLPPGLWLASGSGAIEGTPTRAGNWTFTVQASNGTQTASRAFRLSVKQ